MDGEFDHTVEKFVLSLVASQGDEKIDKVRLVHRLDYATSGVVLVALSKVSTAIAATQFESRAVRKSYLAILHGHIAAAKSVMTWNWAIANGDGFKMELGSCTNPGRMSTSICEVLGYGMYHGAPVSKVRLIPETGRRHQLRLHAAAALHPVVGDATYIEDNAKYFKSNPSFYPPRMMLHAHRLEIRLPRASTPLHGRLSGIRQAEAMQFEAEDPFLNLAGLVISLNTEIGVQNRPKEVIA